MTVWSIVLLLKSALVQLLEAESAHKVFGVELLVHGRDAASGDRFLAARAQRASLQVVVSLAVWQAFVVKETTPSKWLVTLLQKKLQILFVSCIFKMFDRSFCHVEERI